MLISAKRYRETAFEAGSRPTLPTINRWIREGDIAGKRIGGKYFVFTEEQPIIEPKTEPDFSAYESQ